ncbi:hypothetical protein [Flaviaesturariibacter amylovorans]|uniref:Beta-lactamase-inhibitor-like PepSY-like domain-containing protein n=1 Tax=Flaviaesturariibacter amylovorans TaxID=1084520 RepID=A0ABP8HP82_9BACT
MKKVLLAALLVGAQLLAFANTTPAVSEKVLKSFQQTFQSVSDVTWSELDHGYEARFTFNDILTRVVYDRDGVAVKTIRYYYEQQLPLNLLTKVKSSYSSHKIHSITEVTTGDATDYHITLETEKTWTMLLADQSGSMSVQQRFTKA